MSNFTQLLQAILSRTDVGLFLPTDMRIGPKSQYKDRWTFNRNVLIDANKIIDSDSRLPVFAMKALYPNLCLDTGDIEVNKSRDLSVQLLCNVQEGETEAEDFMLCWIGICLHTILRQARFYGFTDSKAFIGIDLVRSLIADSDGLVPKSLGYHHNASNLGIPAPDTAIPDCIDDVANYIVHSAERMAFVRVRFVDERITPLADLVDQQLAG